MSIVVVGGGLVGSMQALMLAQSGGEVKLFDSRKDPREGFEGGKSINLALSTRGRNALQSVDCEEEVLASAVPMKGRFIHTKDGSRFTLPYSPKGECIYSVNRKRLNEILLTKAEQRGVKTNFGHKCVSVSFMDNTVNFEVSDGVNTNSTPYFSQKYEYMFGCDGAHSVVRKEMISSLDLFSQEFIQHNYKELEIPPKDDGFALDSNYLHIWPRNEFMMIALANPDNTFTVTLFLPRTIFSNLNTNYDVTEFFRENFPDVIDLIGVRKLTDDFFQNPTGRLVSVKCSPHHYRNVLLLGDAAHAMVPFYGQGMNAGFEDCSVFQELWEANGRDLQLAMTRYSKVRQPDSHAVCQLSLDNYIEMRRQVNSPVFRLRRHLSFVLAQIFPRVFKPLYPTVAFTNTPYSEIIKMNQVQNYMLILVTALVLGIPLGGVVGSTALIYYLLIKKPPPQPNSYWYYLTYLPKQVRTFLNFI